MKEERKGILKLNGNRIELSIIESSIGPSVLDVTSLYKDTGMFAYDPGFMSTASCESKITFVDGHEGILRYRGYDIAELVKKDYLEIAYLLLYGDLPLESDYQNFRIKINEMAIVPNQVISCIKSFSRDSHPMAILSACFSSLAAVYHDEFEGNVADTQYLFAISAIAKISSIIAMIYRHINNDDFLAFNNNFNYSKNFLHMMFGGSSYEPSNVLEKALDIIFILHADHEQNASTSTVRLTGSTGANVFACLSSGVAALWGGAHGGANEAVINMLTEIASLTNINNFIEKVKAQKEQVRLMGFGHRVYKNYDPRARIIRDICKEVLENLGITNDPLLDIAMKLEEIALKDQYFIDRKLYPNVDFYSGIILKAIGIPTKMFTSIFALARTAGWVSQWHEMVNDGNNRISRPRQLYSGIVSRKV